MLELDTWQCLSVSLGDLVTLCHTPKTPVSVLLIL